MPKLTGEQRLKLLSEINENNISVKDAAAKYGVSRQAVYKLISKPIPPSGERVKGRPPLLSDRSLKQLAKIVQKRNLHIDEAIDLALLMIRGYVKNYLQSRRDFPTHFSQNRQSSLQSKTDSACALVLFNQHGFHLSLPLDISIPTRQELKELENEAKEMSLIDVEQHNDTEDVTICPEYKQWFFDLQYIVWPPGIKKSWRTTRGGKKIGEELLQQKMYRMAASLLDTAENNIKFVNSESRGKKVGLNTLIREAVLKIELPDSEGDTGDLLLQGVAFPVTKQNKIFPYVYHKPASLNSRRSGIRGIFLFYR